MEVLKLSPFAKNMPPRRKRLSRARLLEIPAAIEKLEDRTLLAGNVVVSLAASGLLTVRGDQSANNIAITQTASGLQVASTDSGADRNQRRCRALHGQLHCQKHQHRA